MYYIKNENINAMKYFTIISKLKSFLIKNKNILIALRIILYDVNIVIIYLDAFIVF